MVVCLEEIVDDDRRPVNLCQLHGEQYLGSIYLPIEDDTGILVWVWSETLSREQTVEDQSWIRQGARLYSLCLNRPSIWCVGFAHIWEVWVVVGAIGLPVFVLIAKV